MKLDELKADKVLQRPIFPEPVQVLVTTPVGDAIRVVTSPITVGMVHHLILTPDKHAATKRWVDGVLARKKGLWF